MSNSIDFNDDFDTHPNILNNSNVNALLPLDEDRLIEVDGSGEEIIDEETQEATEDIPVKITKHNFTTSPWTKLSIVGVFLH
ncbi:MAG: hypothetical protein HC815_05915 [Richelia sp. RM1_1_1]|nr:hypothetical protein [Richelia sp. RM1_1_1]